ncbi:MAG: DNA-processing protein DprA [Proteobacteria bacterium]|nr:DNA-processing protein DprA [Pseudomonadota bacterium]MBU1389851.1 DNA-processing protein DprA [Pseudomonadota bacterium]MBU1543860.1 DNA-processing protein DprA [Pseudomonadota bacterium]MBU2431604.1 DNA-processing protein DprA [Pseudomonadota bacterium]MBU2481103.1 DNA-processing protein DprA [Pseudomonadota bacterium]
MPDFLDTYLPWFILREIPMLGDTMYKKLIDHFKTPEAILSASKKQLSQTDKMSARILDGIAQYKTFEPAARKELERLYSRHINIVTLNDPEYPPLLKHIADAPPFLTYMGTLDNSAPCIAIVGSRAATSYGLNTAGNLAFKLAESGFQVVSGMARGIDTAAHKGALKADGKTIAVLGSGLNHIYPKENKDLYTTISQTGTVFSEFKLDAQPLGVNFPKRNRIIAGLCCGTIIVEAAKKSGSLITARLAGEYNREVFAVPGSIASKKSEGTHSLLKQGAKLVETPMDVIDELQHFIHTEKEKIIPVPLQNKISTQYNKNKSDQNMILNLIEPYPVHIDVLIEKSGMIPSLVSSMLFDLEMDKKIIRHQGNYYSTREEHH